MCAKTRFVWACVGVKVVRVQSECRAASPHELGGGSWGEGARPHQNAAAATDLCAVQVFLDKVLQEVTKQQFGSLKTEMILTSASEIFKISSSF